MQSGIDVKSSRRRGSHYCTGYPVSDYSRSSLLQAHPDQPDIPVYYQEARLREHEGKPVWVADVLDIRDPQMPIFGMYLIKKDGSLGEDVSGRVYGTSNS